VGVKVVWEVLRKGKTEYIAAPDDTPVPGKGEWINTPHGWMLVQNVMRDYSAGLTVPPTRIVVRLCRR
jgi:hypothetical protein